MRVLVVDDEAPARARIRRLLTAAPDVEVAGEAADGVAAVEAIADLAPDLVFLDVQMPKLDGFGVVEQVGVDAMPALVFVTAHDAHALRAFEVQALDYLLKPFTPDRFRSVLARVRRLAVPAEERAPRLAAVLREVAPPAPYLRRILVHAGGRARLVPVEEIRRVEAVRNDVRLHTASGEYLLSGSISALEARLDPAEFLRINRSEIVRLDAIREMHPWSHGDYRVVLHDGTTLSWSRRYRARAEGAFSV